MRDILTSASFWAGACTASSIWNIVLFARLKAARWKQKESGRDG